MGPSMRALFQHRAGMPLSSGTSPSYPVMATTRRARNVSMAGFPLTPPANGRQTRLLDVAQGHNDGATWKSERFWNGHETDHGLNFRSPGAILHVKPGT